MRYRGTPTDVKGCGVGAKPGDNIFFLCIGNRKNQLSPNMGNQRVTESTVGVGTEWWSRCMESGGVDWWGWCENAKSPALIQNKTFLKDGKRP